MVMSQNRTEKATEKKQRDSRKKGNVAYSSDASAAAVFGVGFMLIIIMAGSGISRWKQWLRIIWSEDVFSGRVDIVSLIEEITSEILLMSSWVMLPAMLSGVLIGFLQVGPLFRKVDADVSRLNPVKGIQNLFTRKKFQELAKTLIKFKIAIIVFVWIVMSRILPLFSMWDVTLESKMAFCAQFLEILFKHSLCLAAGFGVTDYFLQKHWWLHELKMTIREVRDEFRDSEGDPVLKGLRKQMYQEIVFQNVSERVSRSRLVIVNPTRYAVAIEYDERWSGAPRIVAKGYLHSAARIRSVARESGIPVLRHPPLARRLYELAIDQEIPEDLFKAVAELLIYLIRLSHAERSRCR
jgi:flagellar biosynthesis protein FlhB